MRNDSLLSYRFNQGVPNQFTMTIPEWHTADRTSVAAIFVQDAWTRGRLTLQGALRWDRAWSYSPGGEELNGTPVTSRINPAPISFDTTKSVDTYNDITPRFGVAYDVFGNGRTAVKFNAGHYLDAATNDSAYTRNNPANRMITSVSRGWTDINSNKSSTAICSTSRLRGGRVGANNSRTCASAHGQRPNFNGTSAAPHTVNTETLRAGACAKRLQRGSGAAELMPRISIERLCAPLVPGRNGERQSNSMTVHSYTNTPSDRDAGGGGYPITPTSGSRLAALSGQ